MGKKCPYSELFWSAFSRIQTEYGEIRSISPYSVRMREMRTRITPNMDTLHAVIVSHQNSSKIILLVLTSLPASFKLVLKRGF